MTPPEALMALKLHFDEAQLKHPAIAATGDAITLLQDRLSKVIAAEGSTADPDRDQQLARRLLQLAGSCVRIVVNLGLQEPACSDPPQPATSDPGNTPTTCDTADSNALTSSSPGS